MITPAQIVNAALDAATVQDAMNVQSMLRVALGGEEYRPLADTWNNHGLMGSSGSYDYKLIELVTNMQDAVLELLALQEYGEATDIPFKTPREAASTLLYGVEERDVASQVTVRLRESDPPASKTKRLTPVFRDKGCGLTPDMIARTIFRLGGGHKEDALYLQGAFGMGGAMTYRNAGAVVLVTRRHPDLLAEDEPDVISVAVVEWRSNTKGKTAMYLVDAPWENAGDIAEPWSCPAEKVPGFEPGTHLALISYRTDGIQRKTERDERSFNTVADTRLFAPVMPVLFTNETDRSRSTILRGLERRLEQGTATALPSASQVLPFRAAGQTQHLPVRFVLFDKRREASGIDKFAARDHAVLFTSNGQVHHHWTPAEFRRRTKLHKIHDRVLVVVETDELPILVRTSLFTADRNDLVRTDDAIRLEDAVGAFLSDWDELKDENDRLVREALSAGGEALSADLGRRIGAAFQATGFGGGSGRGNGGGPGKGGRSGGGSPGGRRPITLHPNPTRVEGPAEIKVELGQTRSVGFVVDVVDQFWADERGILVVTTDHPDIGPREITVGRGRAGRVRVMLTVPETAATGRYELTAALRDWHRAAGGLGSELTWTTKVDVVAEIQGRGAGNGRRATGGSAGSDGSGPGSEVVLRWADHTSVDGWEKRDVGDVEYVRAADVAITIEGFEHVAGLGDAKIPVVQLNEQYPAFKTYIAARSRDIDDLSRPRERYALGVGLALLVLDQTRQRLDKADEEYPSEIFHDAARAAARGVLAVMPEFEQVIKKAAGVNDAGDSGETSQYAED
ncbi:hypothetical protein AB0M02_29985 [Actinoplanes sp. NPDC051861]|uniref:hypothetical protein n=1 Tax=Actinoplanes sp. NPDC051861 TaxID=3155170 RepID=UPI00343A1D38